jgi:hypothetical protein
VDSNDNSDFTFFATDPWTEMSAFSFWEDAANWPVS